MERDLLGAIAAPAALCAGWARVRANGGGAGADGETAESFGRALEAQVARLGACLRDGSYRPGPLRRIDLRRPDGRIRRLRIPCVRDRVVQSAAQAALSRRLDGRMAADSYGYRPARSVDQAVARVRALAAAGARWVFDADIAAFFDSVSHARLRDDLAIWIDDVRVVALIGRWLDGFGGGRGLAQGAPISPILSNLFLHPLDRALSAVGVAPVRYADDFVALAADRSGAQRAAGAAAAVLARRGLALNPAKTRIGPLADGLQFLGHDLSFRLPAVTDAG